MAKEIPASHQQIIRLANEAGYFPLKSHLRELNIRAAAILASRPGFGGGKISDTDFAASVMQALKDRYG